jgi:hypothetical protein
MTRRVEFDQEIEAIRHLLSEVSDRLSPPNIQSVDELLRNDEPNEALLCIAEELAPYRDELPERIVRFIKETAGNSRDLPSVFR